MNVGAYNMHNVPIYLRSICGCLCLRIFALFVECRRLVVSTEHKDAETGRWGVRIYHFMLYTYSLHGRRPTLEPWRQCLLMTCFSSERTSSASRQHVTCAVCSVQWTSWYNFHETSPGRRMSGDRRYVWRWATSFNHRANCQRAEKVNVMLRCKQF